MSSRKWKIVIGIIVFVVFAGLPAIIRNLPEETQTIENLSYTRETYVKSCAFWANKEPEAAELGAEFVNTYCGCVYDKGVALYGKEGFTKADKELNDTGYISNELNTIVNQCVQEAL